MTIQWFPGHMTKAKRLVTQHLKEIDIVMEMADARVPLASRNPLLAELVQDKPRILLMNKADLADSHNTDRWRAWFQSREGLTAFPFEAVQSKSVEKLLKLARQRVTEWREEQGRRPLERPLRLMVVGIPNVGKSSLINRFAKKKIAKTGDVPAVTRGAQWVKLGKHAQLLDTPGILWHKFEDQRVGYLLAATGAIKDAVLNIHDVSKFAIDVMAARYPAQLKERYKLQEIAEDREDVLLEIGRKRGCLGPGGVVDLEKASLVVLRDLRAGRLGRMTLERPEEADEKLG